MKYTTSTVTKLNQALDYALSVVNNDNQYEIDEALIQLEKAYSSLQEIRTKEELSKTIEEAEKISNDDNIYTENSYNALKIVLEIAKKVDLENEDEVSYWCTKLERKISNLIRYI